MRIRPCVLRFVALLFVLGSAVAARAAEELLPSHQCLPDETVFVVRVPEGRKFVDAFREQTKLGSVLLSQRRFEGVVNLIREQAAEGLTEFTSSLAKYNLKIEDFPKMFDKELGYAVIVEPRRGKYPLVVGLAWAEPDTDLGQRLLAALTQSIEEAKDEPGATQRIDFDLDGHQVIHLISPQMGPAELAQFEPGDFENLDEEQIKAKIEEQRKKTESAKQVELDQIHVFLTRVGDRILLANTFAQNESETRELLNGDADKKVDLAVITGVEQAKGVFARFVKAHNSPPAGLTPRVMSTPGLAAALPDGVPLVDVLFLAEPLMKLASEAESPTAARILRTLGLDRLGPGALRVALDRGAMRTGLFLSAPDPRSGLLALLDQPSFQADPPAWVPATVLGYGQFSFDLGQAYKLLREVLVSEGGDQVSSMLEQLEQQLSAFTQVDVATLLSSVGQNHYFLTFPPTEAKVAAAGDEAASEVPSSRTGIVWQLKDEAPWKRLIQLGAGFAALSDGMVTAGEEQGFMGLRLKTEDGFTGGVFVGHGYMVLGIGPDVLEPLMSALRNPPEGFAALRNTDLVKRGSQLLPAEACIFYSVSDFDRYLKTFRETFASLFDVTSSLRAQQLALGGATVPGAAPSDEDQVKLMERIKELIPSDEELEGTTGASVGQLFVNQHGVTYRAAVEMPAP